MQIRLGVLLSLLLLVVAVVLYRFSPSSLCRCCRLYKMLVVAVVVLYRFSPSSFCRCCRLYKMRGFGRLKIVVVSVDTFWLYS